MCQPKYQTNKMLLEKDSLNYEKQNGGIALRMTHKPAHNLTVTNTHCVSTAK